MLTYRSGAAGFYDLDNMSGTANLGGFKSGCTSNLVVANGVLNAPDYTRTCSCAYQNQTSLALISMPDMEMWSYSQFGLDAKQGDRILHAGINFGAPGNRRAADGTLWLEYPHVGDGNSPKLGVACVGSHMKWFRHHSSTVTATEGSQPWIAASGFVGEADIAITPSLRRPLLVKPGKKSDDDDDDHKAAGGKSKSPAKPKATAPQTQEPLLKIGFPTRLHTVRLHFADPEHLPPGARVFDVMLQGRKVLENFDLAREGGAAVREFRDIPIGAELRLQLQSSAGATAPPVLCGLEFAAQQEAQ